VYMFVFAKVIPKTLLVPFFSGHGVVVVVVVVVVVGCLPISSWLSLLSVYSYYSPALSADLLLLNVHSVGMECVCQHAA